MSSSIHGVNTQTYTSGSGTWTSPVYCVYLDKVECWGIISLVTDGSNVYAGILQAMA